MVAGFRCFRHHPQGCDRYPGIRMLGMWLLQFKNVHVYVGYDCCSPGHSRLPDPVVHNSHARVNDACHRRSSSWHDGRCCVSKLCEMGIHCQDCCILGAFAAPFRGHWVSPVLLAAAAHYLFPRCAANDCKSASSARPALLLVKGPYHETQFYFMRIKDVGVCLTLQVLVFFIGLSGWFEGVHKLSSVPPFISAFMFQEPVLSPAQQSFWCAKLHQSF
jgi:hypothetical protein